MFDVISINRQDSSYRNPHRPPEMFRIWSYPNDYVPNCDAAITQVSRILGFLHLMPSLGIKPRLKWTVSLHLLR
jgi:hypothetical protein